MSNPPKTNVTPLVPARGTSRQLRSAGNVSPAQRAAVIISLLGEETARPIVEKLDDAMLFKVVEAIENISILRREQLVEIVMDFLGQLRENSGSIQGGRGKARQVLSPLLDAARLNGIFGDNFEPVSSEGFQLEILGGDVWERLQQREPSQIASYLGNHPPNVIALILRRLDPGIMSSILCLLPDEKVSPTLGAMVSNKTVAHEIEAALEKMIEVEFLSARETESSEDNSYLESIGEVLSLLPDQKRTDLVGFLKAQHEDKLTIIERGLFTIDALPEMLPRNYIPVVFKEIDPDQLLKVLASLQRSYPAVSEHLLSNISSRMAEQFREQIKDMNQVSADEAEKFQREFLVKLMELKRQGLIAMTKG